MPASSLALLTNLSYLLDFRARISREYPSHVFKGSMDVLDEFKKGWGDFSPRQEADNLDELYVEAGRFSYFSPGTFMCLSNPSIPRSSGQAHRRPVLQDPRDEGWGVAGRLPRGFG